MAKSNLRHYSLSMGMLIRPSIQTLTIRALSESLSRELMIKVIRILIPQYDVQVRSGYPVNVPISGQDAAKVIVLDVVQEEMFLQLIEILIRFEREGYMGRKYSIVGLRDIVVSILADGFKFDGDLGMFMEDEVHRSTPNWSRLKNGEEGQFVILRIDIVKNTELVRANSLEVIESSYAKFRDIITTVSKSRAGRVWNWEGDSALVAFYFGQKSIQAVLTGMEILHDIFLYNTLECELSTPLAVRMAIHAGTAKYWSDPSELRKNEIVKEIIEIESRKTDQDSLAITQNVLISLDRVLADRFKERKNHDEWKLAYYSIKMETS